MLNRESAHNIFRILMCRDVDLRTLKGILFDFACGAHPYVLNRDPKEFEFLRFLVDGSHWAGQKKLRKPDSTGNGGHLGCCEGYNFNLYKPHIGADYEVNSQGREELHAKIATESRFCMEVPMYSMNKFRIV